MQRIVAALQGIGMWCNRRIEEYTRYKGWFHEKKLLFFWILSKLTPPPHRLNLDNLYHFFFNAKNVDLSNIQNDSLSKILLK